MSHQIHNERNRAEIPESAASRAALSTARLFAGIAINVLGAVVLLSESFCFLNAAI